MVYHLEIAFTGCGKNQWQWHVTEKGMGRDVAHGFAHTRDAALEYAKLMARNDDTAHGQQAALEDLRIDYEP